MAGRYVMPRRLGLLGVAACVAVVACSDSEPSPVATEAVADSTVPSSAAASSPGPTSSTTTTVPRIADGPLAEVCPATIAIQVDTLPDPAMGPLYSLLGSEPAIDPETQTVSAPLVRADGTAEDVVLEIRSGGPAVGFRSPLSLLTADEGLLLAQVSTAEALRSAETDPSMAVITLTDRSRDALIVDPATYPEVATVEAVRDAAIEVRHRTGEPVFEYLAATGALAPEQLVAGFDGEPAAFVQSGGAIAQQGDLLIEPVLFPALPQWARPVTAIPASDSGWAGYDDALVARPADIDELATCLGRLVPVVQHAIVDYVADPTSTDQLMGGIRSSFAPLSRLTPELFDAGVATGLERGVFVDGDRTAGSFDPERLEPFLPDLATALDVAPRTVDELVTDEFIDPEVTAAG